MERYLILALCAGSGLIGVLLCLLVQHFRKWRRDGEWLIRSFRARDENDTLFILHDYRRTGFVPDPRRLFRALPDLLLGSIVHIVFAELPASPAQVDGWTLVVNLDYARIYSEPNGYIFQISDTSEEEGTSRKQARTSYKAICCVLRMTPGCIRREAAA